MKLVKYTLENRANTSNSETGLTTPECITDGGYLYADTDNTFIGYSDGRYTLGSTCTEITEEELEARPSSKEISIKSDGTVYFAPNISLFHKYNDTLSINDKIYKYDDPTCSFYYERPDGCKRYLSGGGMPADKYNQPDSDSQLLVYYSEIVGVLQEWYYEFITFKDMMVFINAHKPISLNSKLEARMKDDPAGNRVSHLLHDDGMYSASLEVAASGEKITTIYVKGTLEDVLLKTPQT